MRVFAEQPHTLNDAVPATLVQGIECFDLPQEFFGEPPGCRVVALAPAMPTKLRYEQGDVYTVRYGQVDLATYGERLVSGLPLRETLTRRYRGYNPRPGHVTAAEAGEIRELLSKAGCKPRKPICFGTVY